MTDLPPAVLDDIFEHLGTKNVARASGAGRDFRRSGKVVLKSRAKSAKTIKKSWKRPTDLVALMDQVSVLRYATLLEVETGRKSSAVEAKLRALGWTKELGEWTSPEVRVGPALVATARTEVADGDDIIVDISVRLETLDLFPTTNGGRRERLVLATADSEDGIMTAHMFPKDYVLTWVQPSARDDVAIAYVHAKHWFPKLKAAIRGKFP